MNSQWEWEWRGKGGEREAGAADQASRHGTRSVIARNPSPSPLSLRRGDRLGKPRQSAPRSGGAQSRARTRARASARRVSPAPSRCRTRREPSRRRRRRRERMRRGGGMLPARSGRGGVGRRAAAQARRGRARSARGKVGVLLLAFLLPPGRCARELLLLPGAFQLADALFQQACFLLLPPSAAVRRLQDRHFAPHFVEARGEILFERRAVGEEERAEVENHGGADADGSAECEGGAEEDTVRGRRRQLALARRAAEIRRRLTRPGTVP